MKEVATNGVTDFDLGVGARKFSGVAGMLEVVEQNLSEHVLEYRSGEGEVSREGRESWDYEDPASRRVQG